MYRQRNPLRVTRHSDERPRIARIFEGLRTHERGVRNFETVMAVVQKAGSTLAPATLRELREAALADEHGSALRASLARHALA